MNPEVKERWLEALRGGRYTQGRHRLRNENECFCCMGVLCDISEAGSWQPDLSYATGPDPGLDRGSSYLPTRLRDSLGISSLQVGTLAAMNDGGQTFAEIADYIEEHI